MSEKNLDKIFDFLHIAGNLKHTYRFSQAPNFPRDTSAAHSWRIALMAMVIIDELKLKIRKEHALKLAIVHDLAEAVSGDVDYKLIVEGKITKQQKQLMEKNALKIMRRALPEEAGTEIEELWKEYEDAETPEARFIKALDKLETLTYLTETGYTSYDMPSHIATYADASIGKFPQLKPVLKHIKQKLKHEFEKGDIEWKKEYG